MDTTQSNRGYKFGQNRAYTPSWNWTRKFITNDDKEIPNANSQILVLPEHESIAISHPNELRVGLVISVRKMIGKPPVYVEYSNNQEHLIYKTKQMVIGKLYHATWKGKKIALRKTLESTIQILEPVE